MINISTTILENPDNPNVNITDVLEEEKIFDDYHYIYQAGRLCKIIINHGWVIDGLHFVYTNLEGKEDIDMTYKHGSNGGECTELVVGENEYIHKFSYTSSVTDYYSARIMTKLKITLINKVTFQENTFSYGGKAPYPSFYRNNFTFNYTADDFHELFAFAGKYSTYMGDLTILHSRKLKTKRIALEIDNPNINFNQNDANILAIECTHTYDLKTKCATEDNEITVVSKKWHSWLGQNSRKLKRSNFSFMSAEECTSKGVLNAIFSGQYKYITIKAHGNQQSLVGPENQSLLSVSSLNKYIENKKKEDSDFINKYKKIFSNMAISFFCCNCGYRTATESGDDGLAVWFARHGVKACFAFSIPLTFASNQADWLVGFSAYTDNEILLQKKPLNDVGKINPEKRFEYALDAINSTKIISKENHNKLVEICNKQTTIQAKNTEVTQYIETNFANQTHKNIVNQYWGMIKNSYHFCSPGTEPASKRKFNMGENCKDFGNSDEYYDLENNIWKQQEKPSQPHTDL